MQTAGTVFGLVLLVLILLGYWQFGLPTSIQDKPINEPNLSAAHVLKNQHSSQNNLKHSRAGAEHAKNPTKAAKAKGDTASAGSQMFDTITPNQRQQLRDAIEDLFSDAFLFHKRAMHDLIGDEGTGVVPFQHLVDFPHMRSLLEETGVEKDFWTDVLADAAHVSPLLKLSDDFTGVSRRSPLLTSQQSSPEVESRTVYLQNVPANATLAQIQEKLKPFGRVASIQRSFASHWEGNETPPQQVESAVIVFASDEAAKKFREHPPTFEFAEKPLKILMKEQFEDLKKLLPWGQRRDQLQGAGQRAIDK